MAQYVVELAQSIPIGVTEVEGFHSSWELRNIFSCSFAPCQAPVRYQYLFIV